MTTCTTTIPGGSTGNPNMHGRGTINMQRSTMRCTLHCTAGRATAHVPRCSKIPRTFAAIPIALPREMRLPSGKVNASWMKDDNAE